MTLVSEKQLLVTKEVRLEVIEVWLEGVGRRIKSNGIARLFYARALTALCHTDKFIGTQANLLYLKEGDH